MKKLGLLIVLLTLTGCEQCFSDACWEQKDRAWMQQQRDYAASIIPIPPYVEFAKRDIGCIVYYSLGPSYLAGLIRLKREDDIPAYKEQERRLVASGLCRMFKKGTRIVSGNGTNGMSADISGDHVYFRLHGNPTRYVTFRDALKPADEEASEE